MPQAAAMITRLGVLRPANFGVTAWGRWQCWYGIKGNSSTIKQLPLGIVKWQWTVPATKLKWTASVEAF